jgi:hypothetical protein
MQIPLCGATPRLLDSRRAWSRSLGDGPRCLSNREEKRVDWPEQSGAKSTYGHLNGCVEVAMVDGKVTVRDSTDPHGPVLRFTVAAWRALVSGVQEGEFDLARLARI